MLSIAFVVIAVLFLAPPLLLLVCVAPHSLLQWVDNRAYKALDVDAYNRNSPYNAPDSSRYIPFVATLYPCKCQARFLTI